MPAGIENSDGQNKLLPAILYLHGAVTYLYPETLWWEVRDIVERNRVVREQFVVLAAVGSLGEPLAVRSNTRIKRDRCGREVAYVDCFDTQNVWNAFRVLCSEPLQKGIQIDPARISVIGYSMGGQAAWDLAIRFGPSLAAVVPFACACKWDNDSWDHIEEIQSALRMLPIRQYSGESDTGAYSLHDFAWLASARGFQTVQESSVNSVSGVSARVLQWGKECNKYEEGNGTCSSETSVALLELYLMSGTRTAHCCWEEVLHDEEGFGLFSWLLDQRTVETLPSAASLSVGDQVIATNEFNTKDTGNKMEQQIQQGLRGVVMDIYPDGDARMRWEGIDWLPDLSNECWHLVRVERKARSMKEIVADIDQAMLEKNYNLLPALYSERDAAQTAASKEVEA